MTAYYSKITKIFYAKHQNQLYRFCSAEYKEKRAGGKEVNVKWVESDFQDICGNSKLWTKATQRQIDDFDLDNKFKEMIEKLPKGVAHGQHRNRF